MNKPPITPDFDVWPLAHTPASVSVKSDALSIIWSDGKESCYHPFLLAENDPSPEILHPLSREAVSSPLDLPEDLKIRGADIENGGVVQVRWSHGRKPSRFHAGWLRGNGWFGASADADAVVPVLWRAKNQPEPPSFDGPMALSNSEIFLEWLKSLRDYGVARLQGLPDADGLLMEIVKRVGPVRESHFGRMYTLEIKDEPDSNAFTSDALMQHIDMPTRECPHGLQFLFCRANTTSGGEGVYVDGYRIAEDLRLQEPEHFEALCDIQWTYNNRSKSTSYKASGPVIERNGKGEVVGIRYNTWLRAPLMASLQEQERAYRSYRDFAARAQDGVYQMKFAYCPGDLVAFDNRRALHGRTGYDAASGVRFIEGIYADRDDLYSAIRILERNFGKQPKP